MKNAIILHGRPHKASYYDPEKSSPSNKHWIPWLQKQLIIQGVLAQTPEVEEPYNPVYKKWAEAIEYFSPNEDTILVGHSCGGGIIIRWLCEHPEVKIDKAVLVAPWIDVEKDDWPLFDFELDQNLASHTKRGLVIFHSDDDYPELQTTYKMLKKQLKNAKYVEFHEYGHFRLGDKMTSEKFPELLKSCLD